MELLLRFMHNKLGIDTGDLASAACSAARSLPAIVRQRFGMRTTVVEPVADVQSFAK
jgi:hypothetical protein